MESPIQQTEQRPHKDAAAGGNQDVITFKEDTGTDADSDNHCGSRDKPYFFEISFIDILLDDIDSDRWLTCSECFDYRTLKCKKSSGSV